MMHTPDAVSSALPTCADYCGWATIPAASYCCDQPRHTLKMDFRGLPWTKDIIDEDRSAAKIQLFACSLSSFTGLLASYLITRWLLTSHCT